MLCFYGIKMCIKLLHGGRLTNVDAAENNMQRYELNSEPRRRGGERIYTAHYYARAPLRPSTASHLNTHTHVSG